MKLSLILKYLTYIKGDEKNIMEHGNWLPKSDNGRWILKISIKIANELELVWNYAKTGAKGTCKTLSINTSSKLLTTY